jgi:hypothetical protein
MIEKRRISMAKEPRITLTTLPEPLINGHCVAGIEGNSTVFASGATMFMALGFLFAREPQLIAGGFTCRPDPTQPESDRRIVYWGTNPAVYAHGLNRIEAIGNFVVIHAHVLGIEIIHVESPPSGALPRRLADEIATEPATVRTRDRHGLHAVK